MSGNGIGNNSLPFFDVKGNGFRELDLARCGFGGVEVVEVSIEELVECYKDLKILSVVLLGL